MNSQPCCRHCGTPFEPSAVEPDFCCAGCSFVHHLILRGGMEKFYDLKGNATLLPAGNSVLLPADTGWALAAQQKGEAAAAALNLDQAEATFDLQGVSCIGCVWLIEATFSRESGAVRCIVDPSRGTVTLRWCLGAFDLPELIRKVAALGYRINAAHDGLGKSPPGASGLKLGLCGGMALNAMAFTLPRYAGMDGHSPLAPIFETIAAFSATVSLLVGGGYFIPRAWAALRLGQLHLDVPISLGILVAWLGSVAGWLMGSPGLLYFDFVAVFIFLMLLGRRLQEASVAANRQRLLRQDPALQTVETPEAGGGGWKRQPASVLAAGEEFRLPPGAVVPVAARLCSGRALLSLDWISGEAEPLQYSAGAVIPAGAIHLGSNALTLVACESWSDSLLARLVADDPAKAATSNAAALWLDRTLRIYLSLVLAAAVIGSTAWLWKGAAWTQAAQVFVSVLVVSCPCALGVAVPLAHDLAVTRLRAVGLFVRSPDLWGRLLRVRKIVFDKTGTLTLDTPRLLDPEALALLPAAASRALSTLVTESRHPISAGLREALASQSLFLPESDRRAEEICGYGLRFEDAEGMAWELRRPVDREAGTQLEEKTDHADTLLTKNAQVAAAFQFAETGRRDAAEIIGGFQKKGLQVFLLSGDREPKVQAMARSLGVPADHAFGRRTPEAKGRWMQARGGDALFIGDGANDALAAQAASCSGSLAVDRTLLAEHSDFYFLSRSLLPLQLLFETAKLRRTAVRRAFILALIYNFFAMILALTGRMNPLLAAVLMPLSSLATIFTVALTINHRQDPRGAGRTREVPLPPALAITP